MQDICLVVHLRAQATCRSSGWQAHIVQRANSLLILILHLQRSLLQCYHRSQPLNEWKRLTRPYARKDVPMLNLSPRPADESLPKIARRTVRKPLRPKKILTKQITYTLTLNRYTPYDFPTTPSGQDLVATIDCANAYQLKIAAYWSSSFYSLTDLLSGGSFKLVLTHLLRIVSCIEQLHLLHFPSEHALTPLTLGVVNTTFHSWVYFVFAWVCVHLISLLILNM